MRRVPLFALLVASHAFASDETVPQTAQTDSREATANDEPTAAEVENAPLPGQESGRLDRFDQDSTARRLARNVLAVPRVTIDAVFLPVRAGIYAYERYSLFGKFKRVSFDDTETYGLYPTLHIDSSYGATLGGRFVHRNLFGEREHFALRGGFGGEFRQLVDANLRSGQRFGDYVAFEMRGEFERRPQDPFYGIGNLDDPMYVRHRQELRRATTMLDLKGTQHFHLHVAGAITDLEYAPAKEGIRIDEVYEPSMLTGWRGMRNAYGELELRLDRRGHASKYDQHAVFDRGAFVSAFAGRVHQLEAGGDYWRYGGEAMHFVGLGASRVLASRLHVESVTGSLADVAFTQLPQLGGKTLLRGYPAERFRDRAAVLGSLEYFWDLSRVLMASVFVDAGRVYPSLADFQVDDMRVGYGASIQLHDKQSFLASVSVATSIDGGVFLSLALDPVFEPPVRVEQK